MVLITIGAVTIASQSNLERKTFTGDDIYDLVVSMRTVLYFSVTALFFFIHRVVLTKLLQDLRNFEVNAEKYD